MEREAADALFIEEHVAYTMSEVVTLTGLPSDELRVLVESGALAPVDASAPQWSFSSWSLEIARRATRVRDEFALDDPHAIAIVVRFEQRLNELQHQLAVLRARHGVR